MMRGIQLCQQGRREKLQVEGSAPSKGLGQDYAQGTEEIVAGEKRAGEGGGASGSGRAGGRGPVNRCWIKLKCNWAHWGDFRLVAPPHQALVSNLYPKGTLMQLKDGPGVTHSMPGTMAA